MAQLDEVGRTLLKAASNLLAHEGPGALTVRRIANDAGMSTMNVYSRFGSKDGVVDHLFIEGFELLAAEMNHVPTTDQPLVDLVGCRDAYRRFARGHSTHYSVMFERAVPDFQPSPAATTVGLHTLAILARRLERAMDTGDLARSDPDTAAAVMWSTCHGVVSLELKGIEPGHIDWSDVYVRATDAVIAGLSVAATR